MALPLLSFLQLKCIRRGRRKRSYAAVLRVSASISQPGSSSIHSPYTPGYSVNGIVDFETRP